MNNMQFTEKATKAIEKAQQLAGASNHTQITPVHLLHAMIDDQDSLLKTIIDKAGGDQQSFERSINKHLVRLPIQDPPPDQIGISAQLSKVLRAANKIQQDQRDSYIAIDHLILALIDESTTKAIFEEAGMQKRAIETAITKIRGGKHVESRNAEEGFEALQKFTIDLTALAREGNLDPVVGRDDEIRRAVRILSRRTKNNPVLIGEPGVGKTSIAEGLAQRIINNDVPGNLSNCRLLSLDVGGLVAGSKYRGEFEERMKSVLSEIESSQDMIILFVDEIHLLMGAGSSGEGGMDAANLLKPMLARGKLHCIGATTLAEYRKYIEKDAAFERRFQTIIVKEPSVPDTISILRGLKEKYEVHHGVTINDSALVAAAQLASRYLTSRKLPDSAIDLVDEAAAAVKVEKDSEPEEIDILERQLLRLQVEIHALEREKDKASKERLATAKKEVANIEEQLRPLREKYLSEKRRGEELQNARKRLDELKYKAEEAKRRKDLSTAADLDFFAIPELAKRIEHLEAVKAKEDAERSVAADDTKIITDSVGPDQITEIVARWTNIPVTKLRTSEKEKLLSMESYLGSRVIGQPEAVSAVANAIRLSRSGLSNPNQPIASFLFCGPSGTGKTLLTKELAQFLFDDEKAMIRIDMSEYMEKHSVSRLIGAPPGYVGHDEGGQLTEQLRRKPFSVILFDEIEKAAPEVLTVLLQVLDDGRLTSGQGHVVDAKNAVIIMTSNLGAEYLSGTSSSSKDGKIDKMARDAVMNSIRGFFRPEFINRISSIVLFNRLTRRDIRKIVDSRLKEVSQRLQQNNRNVTLKLTNEVKDYLGKQGYSPQYGARPLNRLIQNEILNKLAVMLLSGQILDGEVANIELVNDDIVVRPNHDATQFDIQSPDRDMKDADSDYDSGSDSDADLD